MIGRIPIKSGILLISILSLILSLASPIALAENQTISNNLQYKTGTEWDSNNDGVETLNGVIDFTVQYSNFNWNVDYSKLCTRWKALNVDSGSSTLFCNGNADCCSFINLQPMRDKWDHELFLSYGDMGSGYHNIISAQVIYADYSLNFENAYSQIYYSDWAQLPATFLESQKSLNSATLNQNNITLTIHSPDDSIPISNGEEVYLNFTINQNMGASFSFDNNSFAALGYGQEFNTLLSGNLPYRVLENGQHSIIINLNDSGGLAAAFNYSFIVNDSINPNVSVSLGNNSVMYGSGYSQIFNFSSNEYVQLDYKINSQSINKGIVKNAALNLTLQNGLNTLAINASDLNNNPSYITYNFSFSVPSCSNAIQDGEETGIDCGSTCPFNCYPFTLVTDKSIYNPGDSCWVTVMLRDNSAVNISVIFGNTVIYSDYYATSRYLSYFAIFNVVTPGNYTVRAIRYYLNTTESKSVNFSVNQTSEANQLSVALNANSTTINEGEAIAFSSSVSGNISAVSYKWDFNGDGTVDNTSANPVYTYLSNGTFTANLTVSDSRWNKSDSKPITVLKLFNITITVLDNATNSAIQDAEVRIDSIEKNTSSDGKIIFTLPYIGYDVRVQKPGYYTFSEDIDIGNNSIEIRLIEKDDIPPNTLLISPSNNEVLLDNSLYLKFKAIDKSEMNCRLYVKQYTDWVLKNLSIGVKTDSEISVYLTNLDNLTYQWKAICTDIFGNSNASEIYTFTVNESASANTLSTDLGSQDNDTEYIVGQIDSIIAAINNMNPIEKDTADEMQIIPSLERAKTELRRINRDLHNLIWRRINQSELEIETNKLLSNIEEIRKNIPKNLQVLESSEFVTYPKKEDIENASLTLLNFNDAKLDKSQTREYLDRNQNIQSLLTITTKAKIVRIEYLYGGEKIITLLHKAVKVNGDLNNTVLYEVIPKEIANDIGELEVLFDYELIEQDPIIKIDTAKLTDITYYSGKKVDLKEAEKAKSILLSSDWNVKKKSRITGFAIFDNFSGIFIHSSNQRLVIEIIMIALLVIIYVSYSFGGFEKLGNLLGDKELKNLKAQIHLASQDADNKDYEKACSKYKEISSKFEQMDKKKKDHIRNIVIDLLNKVNLLYIHKLADEANTFHQSGNLETAHSNYVKIQSLYKVIPKEYKSEVLKACMELHGKLNPK